MKNSLLLPNRFKIIGWVVFIISIGIQITNQLLNWRFSFLDISYDKGKLPSGLDISWGVNLWNTIIMALIIISLVMVAFSKEKRKDEYISLMRLKSWQWAVLISYGILFVANLLIYSTDFLRFMIYNMFTVLLVFIVVFYRNLFKLRRGGTRDEE